MALTMCPLSNLRLRVIDDLSRHPLRQMMDKGLLVTVNSDDPAYFGGYVNENYSAVSRALGLGRDEIAATVRNGIEASLMTAAEKAEINATLGIAEDLSIRVNTLVTRITEMRRDLFSRLLTRRYEVSFDLVGEVAGAFAETSHTLYRSVSSWLRFVVNFKLSSVLGATAMALIAAIVLLVGSRRAAPYPRSPGGELRAISDGVAERGGRRRRTLPPCCPSPKPRAL